MLSRVECRRFPRPPSSDPSAEHRTSGSRHARRGPLRPSQPARSGQRGRATCSSRSSARSSSARGAGPRAAVDSPSIAASSDQSQALNASIKSDADRARAEALYQRFTEIADDARGRAIPLAAATFVLGAALLALAARGLAGKTNTRSALMQVVTAQASRGRRRYFATRDIRNAELDWEMERTLIHQHETLPPDQYEQVVPMMHEHAAYVLPGWLVCARSRARSSSSRSRARARASSSRPRARRSPRVSAQSGTDRDGADPTDSRRARQPDRRRRGGRATGERRQGARRERARRGRDARRGRRRARRASTLVRVCDDGEGMARDDALLASSATRRARSRASTTSPTSAPSASAARRCRASRRSRVCAARTRPRGRTRASRSSSTGGGAPRVAPERRRRGHDDRGARSVLQRAGAAQVPEGDGDRERARRRRAARHGARPPRRDVRAHARRANRARAPPRGARAPSARSRRPEQRRREPRRVPRRARADSHRGACSRRQSARGRARRGCRSSSTVGRCAIGSSRAPSRRRTARCSSQDATRSASCTSTFRPSSST